MKRRLYSLPVLLVLFVVMLACVRGAYLLMKKERQSARDARELQAKVVELGEREETLKAEIESLHTESGIEEEIKSRYNVAKPGELVAVIIDRDAATSTEPQRLPWYKRLWNAIIGQ